MATIRYYVDADSGSDSNNGLSSGSAWQTLAKVASTVSFATATDQKYVLLKGNTTATYGTGAGGFTMDGNSLVDGSAGIDLYVSTYGTGKATVSIPLGAATSGFFLKNRGGTWLDNITIVGPNVPGSTQANPISNIHAAITTAAVVSTGITNPTSLMAVSIQGAGATHTATGNVVITGTTTGGGTVTDTLALNSNVPVYGTTLFLTVTSIDTTGVTGIGAASSVVVGGANSPWLGGCLSFGLTGASSHAYTNVKVTRVDSSGGDIGIIPSTSTSASADYWSGITVYDSAFHDNAEHGYASYTDPAAKRMTGFLFEKCVFYNNPGRLTDTSRSIGSASGNGVLLGMVDNAVFRHCAAWNNGAGNNNSAGPVSMWPTYCDNAQFYNCEMYSQGSQSTDGAGGDFDLSATHCLYDGCYFHGNAGPGMMFFGNSTNNEVRNCVFADNNKTLSILGTEVRHAGATSGSVMKNNTFFPTRTRTSNRSWLAGEGGASSNSFSIGNNLVVFATDPVTVMDYTAGSDSGLVVKNDYYWSGGNAGNSAGVNRWSGGRFPLTNALPAGEGTETGSTVSIVTPVPDIVAQSSMTSPPTLTSSATIVPTESLSFIDPNVSSPLLAAGATVASASGVVAATVDFRGTTLSGTPNIGASVRIASVSSVSGTNVSISSGQRSASIPSPIVTGSTNVSQRVFYSADQGYVDPSGTWYAPFDTVGSPVSGTVTVTVTSVVNTGKTATVTISTTGDRYVTKASWGFQYILNQNDPLYTKYVTYQGCTSSATPYMLASDPSVAKTIFPGGGNTDRGYRWE